MAVVAARGGSGVQGCLTGNAKHDRRRDPAVTQREVGRCEGKRPDRARRQTSDIRPVYMSRIYFTVCFVLHNYVKRMWDEIKP